MKKIQLNFLSLFMLVSLPGMTQQAQWAKWFAGRSGSEGKQIQADDAGNVYCIGSYAYSLFEGPVDLDPGPGVVNFSLPENGGANYLSKLDPNGNLIWVRSITTAPAVGSLGFEKIRVLPNGDFLLAGRFLRTPDFDFGPGVFNLTSASTSLQQDSVVCDFYIARYSASGSLQWARAFPCQPLDIVPNYPNTNSVSALEIDTENNILFSVNFRGRMDINPGSASDWRESGGLNYNTVVVKLNSNGNYLWGNHFLNGNSRSNTLAIDQQNNIYLNGTFSQGLDFDPGPGQNWVYNYSLDDSYLLKMNPIGEVQWMNRIHGPMGGYGGCKDIIVDADNNVYITGSIVSDTLYFKSAIDSLSLLKSNDFVYEGNNGFVAKINSDGHFIWIKQMTSNSDYGVEGRHVACDSLNNVYVCGLLANSAQFDTSEAASVTYATGDYSGFVAKYDSDGHFIRSSVIDGDRYVNIGDFSLDKYANMYFTGYFFVVNLDPGFPWAVINGTGQIDFDPGLDTLPIIGFGNSPETVFIAKWSQCSAGSDTLSETACNAFIWQGESLSESGVYRKSLTTAERCDSISVLQLTINTSTAAEQNLRICAGESIAVGNETYTNSGTYIQTLSNQAGCDSVLTINVEVDTVNAEISLSENVFSAINPPVNATFQWLNCDSNYSLITGAINPEFIATADGNYAVEINSENCRDTSDCILFSSVGISPTSSTPIQIYPNPSHGIIHIEGDRSAVPFRIIDSQGKVVYAAIKNAPNTKLDLRAFPSGIYFFTTGEFTQSFTLIQP